MPNVPFSNSKFKGFFDIKARVGKKLVMILSSKIEGEYLNEN